MYVRLLILPVIADAEIKIKKILNIKEFFLYEIEKRQPTDYLVMQDMPVHLVIPFYLCNFYL